MSQLLTRISWIKGSYPASLLQRLNEGTERNGNGSISFTASDHSELFELLAHQVSFPADINYRDASNISYRAFLDLRKEGEVDQKSLMSLIAKRVKVWRSRPIKSYTMWTKIRLSQMGLTKSSYYKFDGVRLRIVASLPKWLKIDTYFVSGIGDVYPNLLPNFGYAILSIGARSENEASEKLFSALDKFYAVVNTSWRFNELWVSHRPSGVLLHGPNYFFFEGRKFLGKNQVWWNQDFDEKEWVSFPRSAQDFRLKSDLFRRVLSRLDVHPLRQILERAFVLVSEGMMSSCLSFRLMRFWTAAEVLYTEESSRTPYDQLIDRMIFTEMDEQADVERLKLKRASELRNQYVHRGITDKEDSALIQNLRETILRFAYYILFNGEDFSNHAELLHMLDPSNAPNRVANRLIAIERRRLIIETGRHRV
ncbi:MAG: hypothetical protein ACR2PC_12670 [Tsuneonella suprasediminis]|nr:hypothetical protein LBX01_15960 [Altererythrobacter sp. N1]